MTALRATYRLQLGPSSTSPTPRALVPVPARPRRLAPVPLALVRGAAGSTHGYDVVDPTRISDALGGEEGFRALAATAREAGMGIVLDIVPNHMATDDANPYWADERRARRSSISIPRPGATGASSTSTTSPACARRTRRCSPRRTGWCWRWSREGLVDGLRVDHPDGLADPAGYLQRLRDAGVEHVWVEKILDPGEQLRDWPVEGTVGYEFAIDAAALFVDPAGEAALTALWIELCGDARPFGEWATEAKLEQARTTFAPEVEWLRRAVARVERLERGAGRAAGLPHLHPRPAGAREDLRGAARGGAATRAGSRRRPREFVTRFQQPTPAIMAKGVEDTAFYRYVRLLALNEVGGDPSRFGIDGRRVPRRQRRARGALPARPARQPDARHEALGRRARADRRAGRRWRRTGRRRCAAGASCASRCARAARPTRSRST